MPKLPQHPFPLLLRLEWIVLASVLIDLFIPRFLTKEFNPIVAFTSTLFLGIEGLYVPNSSDWRKYPYLALSMVLIILIALSGGTPRFFFSPGIIVVMRSCYVFGFWGRFVVAVLSLSFMGFIFSSRVGKIFSLLNSSESLSNLLDYDMLIPAINLGFLLLYGMCICFVLIMVDALLSERKHRDRLNLAHEQLREYALRIENQATLEERNRIAREIHDSLGHHLTALNIQLETGIKLLNIDHDRAKQFLVDAKATGSQILKVVRQSVGKLRQDPLEGKSLEEAIQHLANQFYNTVNIVPQCNLQPPKCLPKELQWVTFRVVQESLTNICKHAIQDKDNSDLTVQITISNINQQLTIEITDNGRGFYTNHNISGFGLKGMKERVKAVGGIFQIDSRPDCGCRVLAQLPLPRNIYPIEHQND